MPDIADVAGKNWDGEPARREKIDDLVFDWSLYPRKEVDHKDVVRNYARALKAGCVFPPVKIGLLDGKKIIVDGVHRIKSRQLLKIEYVEAIMLPFETEAELFAESIRLNSTQGKGFSIEDVRANIVKLKKYNFNVKEIVFLTHVPATEISRQSDKRITVMKAPCGKNVYCSGQPDARELVRFKRALMLIRDVARSGCIPTDDMLFKQLVKQCYEALGRVKYNG